MQRLTYVARQLGPVGWIGVGTLVLGLAAGVLGSRWASRDIEQREVSLLQARARLGQLRDPKVVERARDPLAALVQSLPASSQVPEFVAAIERRADRGAVQIDRTEYRLQAVLNHSAQRVRLHFPAHVDYPHLRVWLEGLLHDYPTMTIDELSLRRATDGGEELEATVGLSFLVRDTP